MRNFYQLTLSKFTCCGMLLLFWLFTPSFSVAQTITTYAGNGTGGYSGDGIPATNGELFNPSSLTMDASGNIYIADYSNNRIRKVDAVTKIITTVAGNGIQGFSGDGGLAINAQISGPIDISCDINGNIYFADLQNNRIRKINTSTGIISTVAGNGTSIYVSGSLATNTGIVDANGVTLDKQGNIYIGDYGAHYIFKVDAVSGIMTTIAGNGTPNFIGDGGPATNAGLSPLGMRVDKNGNLFFADNLNNCIRRIDGVTGIITTVAGIGSRTVGYSGDGGIATSARLNAPEDVNVDVAGNLLIADAGNTVIRKVDAATGIITTIAGNGMAGYSGDGRLATCARLWAPSEVITDPSGNIFICDNRNNVIRKVDNNVFAILHPSLQVSASKTSVCLGDTITITSTLTNGDTNHVYQWKRNGQPVGINAPGYTTVTTSTSDTFVCVFACINNACQNDTVISNSVVVKSTPVVQPNISLTASDTAICSGDPVSFTAVPTNGGTAPVYQWELNGHTVAVTGPVYTINSLASTPYIICTLFSNAVCARPSVVTDTITIVVHPIDTPTIAIFTPDSIVCIGTNVTFTAYTSNASTNPTFEWMINGIVTGSNSPQFVPGNLVDGDVISCLLFVDSTKGCVRPGHMLSNNIKMGVKPIPEPAVDVQASANDVCQGLPVTFTATLLNGGSNPVYEWQINGNTTGATGPSFTSSNLADGDQVSCILKGGNLLCPIGSGIASDTVIMTIKPVPVVTVDPADTSIYAGHSVPIHVTVIGTISSFNWQPSGGLSDPTSLTPVATPVQSTQYFLQVIGDNGCETDKTSNIKIYRVLNMPNAFTPGRTINNIFRIPPGVGLSLKEFSVFNRWGQRIFTTSDISRGWDGTFHGAVCDTGTYVYFLTGTSQGKEVAIKGTVTLIK